MNKTKILVVDNNEPDLEVLIRQTFRKKMQENVLDFIFSHSREEALSQALKDPSIEIVLTDVRSQFDDHPQILSKAAQLKRILKTIVITPYGDIESIRIAMNKGAFDFITRPINLQDLEHTVFKTIDQLKKLREIEQVESKLIDMEKELDVAKSIQYSILPHDFDPIPLHKSFEVYGTMLPARGVGGDFYDFFAIDETHLAFTIADVSGKGVPAALFMTMTRGLLRALGQKTRSPVNCFKQVNEIISMENESAMFVTAFYGILDVTNGIVEYCNAGHNPPYLITPEGDLTQIGRCEGIALGVLKDDQHFQQKSLKLEKGATFLLYTDGVTEAMDLAGQLFTEARLEEILRKKAKDPLKDILKSIVDAVNQFSHDREQSDDITLLGIRYLR